MYDAKDYATVMRLTNKTCDALKDMGVRKLGVCAATGLIYVDGGSDAEQYVVSVFNDLTDELAQQVTVGDSYADDHTQVQDKINWTGDPQRDAQAIAEIIFPLLPKNFK